MQRGKKYVSEDLTNEVIDNFSNEFIYLIGAECGSGKTTAIMENLVSHARFNEKSVLFLCNRISPYGQLAKKYLRKGEKHKSFTTLGNVTLGMYQSITSLIKKFRNFELFEKHYDYVIVDEAHLIYDAADYDTTSCLFLEFLNRQTHILIALTGTSDSFIKLEDYLNRDIKILRDVDRTNNNVRKVTLVSDRNQYIHMKKEYLYKDYKLLELVSSVFFKMSDFHRELDEFHTANALSESNQYYFYLMDDDSKDIYEEIINKGRMSCDALMVTSFFDVGVSIKADTNFVVAYDCTEMPNTIEQLANRIRFERNSEYHLDIIFYVKKPRLDILNKLKEEFSEIEFFYEDIAEPKEILNRNFGGFGEIDYESSLINNMKINPIRRSLLIDKINFFESIYNSPRPASIFKQMFENMFPNATIIDEKMSRLAEELEEYFNGANKIELITKQEIIEFREWIRQYRIHKGHGNERPGKDRINKFFLNENLFYYIKGNRKTINGKQERIWEVNKVEPF